MHFPRYPNRESWLRCLLRRVRLLALALQSIGWFALSCPVALAQPIEQAKDAAQPRLHRNQIPFAGSPDSPLVLDASVPMQGERHPAVIVVHGGGWEAGDRRTYVNPLLELLEASPYAWFSIDHRLAPAHPYPAALDDVRAAIRWVHARRTEFRVDPDRIFLVGESSGGHLVSLAGALESAKLAGRPEGARLAGVVPFYGIHNFENWLLVDGTVRRNAGQFLGVRTVDAQTLPRIREASPVNHVHQAMPPYLFIHGEMDAGVPFAQSEEMCKAIRAQGGSCGVFLLRGAGHGMENWERNPAHSSWKPVLLDWLAEQAGRPGARP
jgi:alpha-L-fucosidase 2